ncbi:hypothetical protein I553_6455 [Mycobacterium xenopi 4042]|uniref:Uncharacterized protein n=1 Tax=Mycobacterium xenopi 4042 TaxID=1299334 RepID=X8BHP6_MYCXE|nr:hypothetical protein I553_6455 [Mycobacterium xenopi 4042]
MSGVEPDRAARAGGDRGAVAGGLRRGPPVAIRLVSSIGSGIGYHV